MKYFSLLCLSVFFFGCKVKKNELSQETSFDGDRFIGVVHVAEDGCPYYIAIPEALNKDKAVDFARVYPVNLKDGMKKKGLKVQFSYTLSKAMSPEGCIADAVVQINEITVVP
jgi:hypothetical protein